MIRYIALLRSINVGGHNVKMEDLRGYFTELGFANVRSYIQTGNIFFEAEEVDILVLTHSIEVHLEAKLGYAVPTFIRTLEQLEYTLDKSPFEIRELTPDTRHMLVFTSELIPESTQFPLVSRKGDYEVIGAEGNELYVIIRLINGKFLSSKFIEKTFKVTSTGRFLHTSLKILAAAKA
jgi:uncharacterized protein (DUF1697 family)